MSFTTDVFWYVDVVAFSQSVNVYAVRVSYIGIGRGGGIAINIIPNAE